MYESLCQNLLFLIVHEFQEITKNFRNKKDKDGNFVMHDAKQDLIFITRIIVTRMDVEVRTPLLLNSVTPQFQSLTP